MASFSIATIWWQTQGQHWLKHGVCVCVCVCVRACVCVLMYVCREGGCKGVCMDGCTYSIEQMREATNVQE